MSFTNELYVYREVVSQGIIAKPNFMESELVQCTVSSKQEDIGESLVVDEEMVVDANGHSLDKVDGCTEATMYFQENLDSCENVATEFDESMETLALSEDSSIEKWDCENVEASTLKENESEEQDDDEETIATFVTAAGQQLALYAVEDSDEIFAVAVYDESGEPPSNFQFLMKADVERLIGEGAVRTVKKPLQMKKRVLTTHPPMFYHKDEFEEVNNKISTYDTSINSKKSVVQVEENGKMEYSYKTYQNSSNSIKINSKSGVDKQSDVTYLMMDDSFLNIAEQPDERQDDLESEDELMERSTVQYMFLEGDHQSDSELTFDDIQATLQNMKVPREKTSERNDKESDKSQDDYTNVQEDLREFSARIESSPSELKCCTSPQSTIDRTCVSVLESDRQRLIDALTDSPPSTTTAAISSQTPLKVKRSRKQQLISVDRDDGEIIIQPASMLNEEKTGKKRTPRRRQLSSQIRDAVANAKRIKQTDRIKRTKRRKVVEVIDLDVDEEEQHTRRNVVEITLDDNKDKYSSDKENEIIMVRDSDSDNSDDEEEEEEDERQSGVRLTKLNGVIQCEYCSRNFRYRRTLDMHLLACQKSPTYANNLGKRKPKSKDESQQVRKQYTCKICQEKFDVVVALARHARAAHSQRKKQKLSFSPAKTSSKSLRSVQQKETTSTEEEELDDDDDDDDDTAKRELSMLARVKRKRKQRNNCSLETKKLDCAICGRWFPSSALLNAHSLHHGTKKSERLHKCHICKKLIKSRLMFLRHLKMHNDAQRSSGSSRMLRRKLRARPSTRKIASPRKRGRPRKF